MCGLFIFSVCSLLLIMCCLLYLRNFYPSSKSVAFFTNDKIVLQYTYLSEYVHIVKKSKLLVQCFVYCYAILCGSEQKLNILSKCRVGDCV